VRLRVYLPEGTSDWESSVALFRVGRGDSCALRFEGALAKYASWEHAEFSVDEGGVAYVTDLGSSNGTYVDGERIAEATPLRVGTTVQIGSKGPRLDVLALPPRPGTSLSESPARSYERWVIIGLAAALLAVVAFFLVRGGGARPEPAGQQQANPSVVDVDSVGGEGVPDDKPPIKSDKPLAKSRPVVQPPIEPPIPPALAPAFAAYRLIAIEDPETQTTRPFAGAVIITPQSLLTTADVGVELARVRERGWTIKVVRDPHDSGVLIDRIRIPAAYQEAASGEQPYIGFAILSVAERLTGAVRQATIDELNALKEGSPLVCVAVDHGGDTFDSFEELRAAQYSATVTKVNHLSPDADPDLRVLSLHGEFGDNPAGSPMFNDRGHLVALYFDAAPLAGDTRDRANHFATLIDRGLIQSGITQRDDETWVEPKVSTDQANSKESEK
jgi:hypothetical protein